MAEEKDWDNIEVDYPPEIMEEIEEIERKYFEREREVR
jgi:hypothetical protein